MENFPPPLQENAEQHHNPNKQLKEMRSILEELRTVLGTLRNDSITFPAQEPTTTNVAEAPTMPLTHPSRRDILRGGAALLGSLILGSTPREIMAVENAKEKRSDPEQYGTVVDGIDFDRLARIGGMQARLEVNAPKDARYIVHMGQIHSNPIRDGGERVKVAANQDQLERILLVMKSRTSPNSPFLVFAEGVTPKIEKELKEMRNLLDRLDQIPLQEEVIEEQLSLWNDLILDAQRSYPSTTILFIERFRLHIVYALESKNLKTASINALERLGKTLDSTCLSLLSKYAAGGALRLFFKHKADIAASEEESAYDKTISKVDEFRKKSTLAQKTLYTAQKKKASLIPEEKKTVDAAMLCATELDVVQKTIREPAIIRSIAQRNKSQNRFLVLELGSRHKLKNNILEWNRQHPEQPLGLISIKTKETFQKEDASEDKNRTK